MSNKILLADDSITIQKVVNLTFTDEGINVVTVGNGELAVKKLGEEHYDLVLADIFMPGRNGYEVCEFVKTNPQMRDVPVILLVGAFEPFDKSEAARVQADGHLTKPFESRILIETVKRMLAEAAVRRVQAAPQDSGSAYRGQVVGWDVPTTQISQQELDEEEPEPPPYDPYASTAKLPPLREPFGLKEPTSAEADNPTLDFGAPIPTGALFTPPGAEPPPPEMFEYEEPQPEPAEPVARAIEGPPDSVAGFSFDTSGPLQATDVAEEPPVERPSIGYQEIHATDSPLDLPDLGIVEAHRHEQAEIEEVRDPLLETFADVAESTVQVEAPAAPGLEVNVHEETAPSMHVGPTEGLVSAWDRSAQPEAPPQAPPEPVAEEQAPASDAGTWQTQAFSTLNTPFGFTEEAAVEAALPEASSDTDETAAAPSFELPPELPVEPPPAAEQRPAGKSTVGLSGLSSLETLRSGPATMRFTLDDFEAVTAPPEASEAPEAVEEAPAEPAPSSWTPEVEEAAEPVAEAAAPAEEAPAEEAPVAEEAAAPEAAAPEVTPEVVAEPAAVEETAAAPVNGSGAGVHGGIPQEILDEVVRRTVERMSDDVIREIAWEIVPDLAEQLIKKRLSENR